MREIGIKIMTNTNYKLLCSRILHPNLFLYPPNSLESKKQLLFSLSPMLSEAESQRLKDTMECENFTRCKWGKAKTKSSSYEYIDIDTQNVIQYEDYEKRFFFSYCFL
jgi:hypothetical protein